MMNIRNTHAVKIFNKLYHIIPVTLLAIWVALPSNEMESSFYVTKTMGSGWKQTGNDPLFAPLAIRSVATACIKASYLFSPLFPHHPQSSSFARVVFEVDRQPANHPFTRSPATTTCNLRMNGWRNRHKRLDRVLTQGHGLYQADGIVRLKAARHCLPPQRNAIALDDGILCSTVFRSSSQCAPSCYWTSILLCYCCEWVSKGVWFE